MGVLFVVLGPRGSRSERSGEHESGLESCSLRATRLAPGYSEVVAATQSLGLSQTLEMLRPSDRFVGVHGFSR